MFLSGYLRTYLRTAALSHDRWPSTSVKQGMRQSKWGLKTQQQHAIMYRLCLSGRSDSSKVSSRSHQKTLPSPRACSLGSDLNTHTNAARDSSDQGGGSVAGKSPWSSVLTAANALRSHWSPSLTHLRPVGTYLYFTLYSLYLPSNSGARQRAIHLRHCFAGVCTSTWTSLGS